MLHYRKNVNLIKIVGGFPANRALKTTKNLVTSCIAFSCIAGIHCGGGGVTSLIAYFFYPRHTPRRGRAKLFMLRYRGAAGDLNPE